VRARDLERFIMNTAISFRSNAEQHPMYPKNSTASTFFKLDDEEEGSGFLSSLVDAFRDIVPSKCLDELLGPVDDGFDNEKRTAEDSAEEKVDDTMPSPAFNCLTDAAPMQLLPSDPPPQCDDVSTVPAADEASIVEVQQFDTTLDDTSGSVSLTSTFPATDTLSSTPEGTSSTITLFTPCPGANLDLYSHSFSSFPCLYTAASLAIHQQQRHQQQALLWSPPYYLITQSGAQSDQGKSDHNGHQQVPKLARDTSWTDGCMFGSMRELSESLQDEVQMGIPPLEVVAACLSMDPLAYSIAPTIHPHPLMAQQQQQQQQQDCILTSQPAAQQQSRRPSDGGAHFSVFTYLKNEPQDLAMTSPSTNANTCLGTCGDSGRTGNTEDTAPSSTLGHHHQHHRHRQRHKRTAHGKPHAKQHKSKTKRKKSKVGEFCSHFCLDSAPASSSSSSSSSSGLSSSPSSSSSLADNDHPQQQEPAPHQGYGTTEKIDITSLLLMPQKQAAHVMNISPATLSKRFRETNHRRWPYRQVSLLRKKLEVAIEKNDSGSIPQLEAEIQGLLSTCFIYGK